MDRNRRLQTTPMRRARTLAIVILLLSYGAVGARQPAVRASVPLPVSSQVIADALGLPSSDPATLLLHVVRLVFATPDTDLRLTTALQQTLRTPRGKTTDTVPLPLDSSIWRETLLQVKGSDPQIVAAILGDRRAALLYHGLFALDDDTLAWLGADRETLLHMRARPGRFATLGRSIRVRAGHVVVPGGTDAEPLWEALTGVSPARPSAFVQRLVADGDGWLALLYDAVAHLDPARQRFALGLALPASSREDRLRALLSAFESGDRTWNPERTPFARPALDPSVFFSTLTVSESGQLKGPMGRRLWEQVFHKDEGIDVEFSVVPADDSLHEPDTASVDAAWLAARIAGVPFSLGRRRLDTVLFAQRVFTEPGAGQTAVVATALRGFTAFPALMLTLERTGVTEPASLGRAAEHAQALGAIPTEPLRRTAVTEFQAALGIIERAHRSRALTGSSAQALVGSLCSIDISSGREYATAFAKWFGAELVHALPGGVADDVAPVEATVLAAMAGKLTTEPPVTFVEWEGQRYRVDSADAEYRRLRLVREAQGGASLDMALGVAASAGPGGQSAKTTAANADRTLAGVLASIVYAAHLGDPDGKAVTSGNVALRHDFGFSAGTGVGQTADAWRLPTEDFNQKSGWRLHGAMLGLETALGRLSLRRLDPTHMPAEPKMGTADRHIAGITVALLNPFEMTDSGRDEIAAALGRGRARAAALSSDPADLDRTARAAGLSEWRRQALAWTLAENRGDAPTRFSLVELFWLGTPRGSAIRALDAWGAALLPLTGCLCLKMPAATPWEDISGRPSSGLLATRAADVALRVADSLAALKLPASLAPFVLGFAMQEVTDHARPGYVTDWDEFERAARDLPTNRVADYVAALTARGPLVPAAPRPE